MRRVSARVAPPASCATLAEYVEDLRAAGVPIAAGSSGTYWVASGDRVALRLPTFHVGTPSESEVDDALRSTGGVIASYLTEPDDYHAANAWLYLCADHHYSLTMRAPAMQRNVRRAMRELTIAPLAPDELVSHGLRAFCDTRRRNGLDDASASGFRRYFESRVDRPGRVYLGAWKNDQLAAFVTILHVDDWAELGCFSMNAMLRYRPNDALMFVALSTYLGERNCRVVSYGLSSLQASSNATGLHRFKRKVGFDPSPVHRAFVLHPSLRTFASRRALQAAHWTVAGALRVRPRNGRLRKLEGMLACMRGATSMMPAAARDSDGETRDGRTLQRDPVCTM